MFHGLEQDVDPLDAYMQTIQEANASNSALNERRALDRQKESNHVDFSDLGPKALKDAILDNEGLDQEASQMASSKQDTNYETVEDLLAYAQRQARKKELAPVDHKAQSYARFRKNFYTQSGDIERLTEAEVNILRAELDNIKVRGLRCPKPVKRWTHCNLISKVFDIIKELGYKKPTPIQAQAVPAILSGRDIIGIAKTGSGKTLAFILPMLKHVMDQPEVQAGEGPVALIMTPTRELAMQTYFEAKRFTSKLGIRVVCLYGGAPIKEQIAEMKRGAEMVICTPGRLIDMLVANNGHVTNLQRVTYLVLDEADRMFDMGFGPQITRIIDNIRPDKQAVLFSATFPRSMEELAKKVLSRPVEIIVGLKSVVCPDVTQQVEVIDEEEKFLRLLQILGEWYPKKTKRILVFVDTQDAADDLLKHLLFKGYPCMNLHGGKDQADRDTAISDFKSGVVPVLIATSVAARGLDVKSLGLVINYECPNHMEDYVHRVGRTGRAGNKGTAITFITYMQEKHAPDIVRALVSSKVPVPEKLQRLCDEFMAKVRKGLAQVTGSGFGGKGLERFEQDRVTQKRTHMIAHADDEVLSDGELEVKQTAIEMAAHASSTNNAVTSALPATPGAPSSNAPLSSMAAAKASSSASAGGTPLPGGATKPASAPSPQAPSPLPPSPATATTTAFGGNPALYDAMRQAKQAAAQIAQRVAASGGNTESRVPSHASSGRLFGKALFDALSRGDIVPIYDPTIPVPPGGEPMPKGYLCEIVINGFSQFVRFAICNKESIQMLAEISGASIAVRGSYIPPGRPHTDRPLFLHIESPSQHAVEVAKREVMKTLKELLSAEGRAGSGTGLELTI